MLEYEKFQEMQSKMMKMQEEYERQLIEKEESKQRDMERQTEYYETKLQEMTAKLEQVGIKEEIDCYIIIIAYRKIGSSLIGTSTSKGRQPNAN